MMDILLRWLPVVILVGQVLMAWGMWSLKKEFVSHKDCKDCKKEQSEKDEKVTTRISDLPPRSELKDLSDKIGKLSEKLGHLDGRLTGINRAVDLLNQHHLGVKG